MQCALVIAYRLAFAYWFVFRPQTKGAYVAVWVQDQLLLIRNSYKAGFTFPAGGLKKGETPLQGAVRELREEVGVKINPEDLRFVAEFQTRSEFKLDTSSVFELRLPTVPTIHLDQREVVACTWVTFQQAVTSDVAPVVKAYLDHLTS
ncbi:MAG: NUDIX hydrolase [Pirellulaceae bacterium]